MFAWKEAATWATSLSECSLPFVPHEVGPPAGGDARLTADRSVEWHSTGRSRL